MSKRTSFSVDLRASIDEALYNAENTVTGAVKVLLTKIVQKTPVDTGKLQKNWNVKLGGFDLTIHETNAVDPITRADKELKKYDLKTKSIGISNNLPYAYDIEYGKSKVKAPQGMLRVSLQEFDTIFKGTAMSVNKGAGSKQNRYK